MKLTDRLAFIRDLNAAETIRAETQELNFAFNYQELAEIYNECLAKMIKLCSDGQYDSITKRLLFNVPWSRLGQNIWQLNTSEAYVFRSIMLTRSKSRYVLPIFSYDKTAKRWIYNYPEQNKAALAALKEHEITADEVRTAVDAYRFKYRNYHNK